MRRRFEGRSVIVTGGTSGIGLEIAISFLREGASVLITGRDRERGKDAETRLTSLGPCCFISADASSVDDVESVMERVVALYGGLDVLVNNAGVGLVAPISETSEDDWDRIMDVNVKGYFLHARAALPLLAERKGCMVHVASDAGLIGERMAGAYSVSKAAVIMLSKMFALDGGPLGVRSNCVCPGDTTPGMRHMILPGGKMRPNDHWHAWPLPPIGRYGTAEDVASAVAFLASDEASFCSGAVLLVDGGMRAGFLDR